MSTVRNRSNKMIKENEITSFNDVSPVNSANSKTILTNTTNDIVIYSGLNFFTFCKLNSS